MTKLQALTAYLIGRQMVAPEQLDSWTEQVHLELIWKPDLQGMRMADMKYTAAIVLERFNDHPGRLMALVGSWLETHDNNRDDLPPAVFDITMLDGDLADVDIKLEFVEPQYLAEDPDGEIAAYGRTWSFIPFDLWVAENGEVASGAA